MNARVLLLLFAGACSGSAACGSSSSSSNSSSTAEGSSASTTGETNEETAGGATGPESPAEPQPDPGPVPVLRILGDADGDGLNMRIQVTGSEPVRLSREALIEHQDEGEWRRVDVAFPLRSSCEDTSEGCLELAPGAEFILPTWAVGQCTDNAMLSPGTYRLRVESCAPEGTVPHRVTGEAIVFP